MAENKIFMTLREASAEDLFGMVETVFIDLKIARRGKTPDQDDELTVGEIAEYLFTLARDETAVEADDAFEDDTPAADARGQDTETADG